MTKRTCTNISCAMKNAQIDTDRSTCVSCGRELSSPSAGLFGDFGDLFDSMFGKPPPGASKERTVPDEVVIALREVESVLASFIAGTAVKRSELEAAHTKCTTALRRFG